MTGQPPAYRILTKKDAETNFTEIGAVWATSKAETFGVRLKIDDVEINGILVKNKPKADAEPSKPSGKKNTAQAKATL